MELTTITNKKKIKKQNWTHQVGLIRAELTGESGGPFRDRSAAAFVHS